MNGNPFSIKTNDEAYNLAVYLAETDAEWVYNVAPFDPQRHKGIRGCANSFWSG